MQADAALTEYLQSEDGQTVEPWELDVLRDLGQGRGLSARTYGELRAALRVTLRAAPRSPEIASE